MSQLSDAAFSKLVNDDVRENVNEDQARFLRTPEQLDRWQVELIRMKRSIEKQLANDRADRAEARVRIKSKSEWNQYIAERERWRASTIRLLNGVDLKLVEVRSFKRKHSDNHLYAAILRHRQSVLNSAVDPEPADLALWGEVGA